MISEELILKQIERQPKGTAGYKQLVRELGLRGNERRELENVLRGMQRRGEIVEIGRDRYSLPVSMATRMNLVAGRLNAHRDGYGFVIPQNAALKKKISGDIFIPPSGIGMAMHGDSVLVELGKIHPDGRAEGRIVKVAGRSHPTVVGVFHYGRKYNYVLPIDEKLTQEIIIPPGKETPALEAVGAEAEASGERRRVTSHRVLGKEAQRREWDDLEDVVVDVEITQWPSPTQSAYGRVIEIIGYEDDFGADVEIMIRKHHLPHIFPDEVLREAQDLSGVMPHREIAARHDYRSLPIVTIDGETARDFDDAVHVRRLVNGNFELQVHIADVAHYVREGMALDGEARLRGTSVYFPDRAVPMLPLELSTDICSLRPSLDRLVLSCIMELDHEGEVVSYELHEGIIRSAARMTYTNVQLILDGYEAARREYAALVENFELMREAAELLNRKRMRRGSIDFDLPEPVIEFDEQGLMRGVTRSERKFSNRLIEEFMLAANECVAAFMEGNGIAALYRIHEKPDPRKVFDFEMMAASFGYSLGVGALPVKKAPFHGSSRDQSHRSGHGPRELEIPQEVHITPRMYQKLTQKIAGKPEERILSYLMLRSLKQAKYSEVNEGHFALAATTYTHFTSPIRRYPDLIVHRILKEVLHSTESRLPSAPPGVSGEAVHSQSGTPWSKRQKSGDRHAGRRRSKHQEMIAEQARGERSGPIPEPALHEIAEECSQSERRAEEAERELTEWKKIRFMSDRIGDEFDALVISTTKYGFFVELTDMFIEGIVPINTLIDDRYTFRENTRQIMGERSKKAISIGDRVRVILDRIDRMQRKLQFAMVVERPLRAVKSQALTKTKWRGKGKLKKKR